MLISLRSSLQTDIVKGINHCHKEVQAIGIRVYRVEQQMDEFSSTYNTMVDAHAAQREDIAWLKDKVADLKGPFQKEQLKTARRPRVCTGHTPPTICPCSVFHSSSYTDHTRPYSGQNSQDPQAVLPSRGYPKRHTTKGPLLSCEGTDPANSMQARQCTSTVR